VTEEERDDAFFKGLLLKDSPGATMWQPGNDILIFSIGKNHVKLSRKGGFLVSSSRGVLSAPSDCSATSMFLGENARVVPVSTRVCASACACALSISSNTRLGVGVARRRRVIIAHLNFSFRTRSVCADRDRDSIKLVLQLVAQRRGTGRGHFAWLCLALLGLAWRRS
jgi:hypothetical protein